MRRLLIRPGAIGDVLVCLPAMESLKVDYTEVWAPSKVLPLIRFADRAGGITGTGLELLGLPGVEPPPAVLERLRGFDSIVSWYGSNRADFRQHVEQLALPFRFLRALPPGDNPLHVTDYFLEQVGAPLGQRPRIKVEAKRHGAFVIHPFSGSGRKNLPLSTYRAVASRLGGPVEWCAGPDEPLAGAVHIPNLYDLACWIGGAKVFIGNDAGITHLAAAAGAPVVAIFGPTNPALWAPRGENVRVVSGDLETITADEIVAAVRDLAGSGG